MKTAKLFLLSALALFACANLYAQVTIGGMEEPKSGAILDLNSTAKGGLLLSNVTITDLEFIPYDTNAFPGITTDADADVNPGLCGAMVYNTGQGTAVPPGIYIWNGYYWSPDGACIPLITSSSRSSVSIFAGQSTTMSVNASCDTQYQWYEGADVNSGSPISGAGTASYTTPASLPEGTYHYFCKVSSSSNPTEAISDVFTVNVGPNLASMYAGYGTFRGRRCFDIAAGEENNGKNGCSSWTNRENHKTDFSDRTPHDYDGSLLTTGVQVYTFVSNYDAVRNVRFAYEELSGSSIDSIVPLGDYSGYITRTEPCKVAVYYRQSLNSDLLNKTRAEGNTVKLYAIFRDNQGYDRKLELSASLQDCACCDGLLLENGAWDYANGSPGDWAIGKTVTAYDQQENMDLEVPNNLIMTDESTLFSYFKPSSSGALCWYKKDDGGNWPIAVSRCANGEGADGNPDGGWYLPNIRELDYLKRYLISVTGLMHGTPTIFGDSPDASVLAGQRYWSSTENISLNSKRYAHVLYFGGAGIDAIKVGNGFFSRCVRRL